MGKLINRIPGSYLLISSDRFASLAMSTSVLKALPCKLDIKRHSPSMFYVDEPTTRPGKGGPSIPYPLIILKNISHIPKINNPKIQKALYPQMPKIDPSILYPF